MHVQITRAVHEHVDQMRVRLDPPDLGQVEIRLDFGDDSRFRAVVAVERSETLDLLQRDAAALERSLREAGLRADGGGLSFTLKREQEGSMSGQAGRDGAGAGSDHGESLETAHGAEGWRALGSGLIDISA